MKEKPKTFKWFYVDLSDGAVNIFARRVDPRPHHIYEPDICCPPLPKPITPDDADALAAALVQAAAWARAIQ